MGIMSALSRFKGSFPPTITTNWPGIPVLTFGGEWDGHSTVDYHDVLEMSATQLWRSQPHLRTVVDFLARNIAQLGVHAFIRQDDGDRTRTTTDIAARIFQRPNPYMTRYELISSLVGDLALHSDAYWMVTRGGAVGWTITPIPASWVMGIKGTDAYHPDTFIIQPPLGAQVEVDAKLVEHFHGWDPVDPSSGTSPVQTLKATLLEQMHAQKYREQQWRRGGRVGAVISRPPGHRWTDDQERRFMLAFRDAYSGDNAPEGGGIPILQDGMTMNRIGFSAKEDEYVEGTKLALSTVAGVYHVNPTMLGALDNATLSNVKEFRRMLYGDTLGPWLSQIEDRVNTFVLPRIGADPLVFIEFNIAEKLKGSFEEQAGVLSTSVGAPWMTRNEARARQNLSAQPGGDELITPLNVLIGGQASPQDGGAATGTQAAALDLVAARVVQLLKATVEAPTAAPEGRKVLQQGNARVSVKSEPRDAHTAAFVGVLSGFFERQGRSVMSTLGGKADPDWWDAARWDAELADELFAQAQIVAGEVGADTAKALGFDPTAYNVDQTLAFLRAVAKSRASMINATTRDEITTALAAPAGSAITLASVFAFAVGARAMMAGTTLTTTFTAFATTEAAKQTSPRQSMKTWIVTSRNPRPEHSAMNGETVPTEEQFSNGADWPGDPSLGAAGVANCMCIVEVGTT